MTRKLNRRPEQQPITYTSRKGLTYVLCRTSTPSGRTRYVFARQPRGEILQTLPTGFAIRESVNGIVSLVRDRPPVFSSQEIEVVEAAVRRHPKASMYRVAARPDHLAVYERSGPEADDILDILGRVMLPTARARAQVEETLEQGAVYTPVLRFRLLQAESRTFGVERRWYSDTGDRWLPLARTGPLRELAAQVVPLIGTDAFFELW